MLGYSLEIVYHGKKPKMSNKLRKDWNVAHRFLVAMWVCVFWLSESQRIMHGKFHGLPLGLGWVSVD